VSCTVTLQRKQKLSTRSTAAILRNQAGNDPPVSDEEKAVLYAAHAPYPSTLRRSSTPSPAVELSPRPPAPLFPEPPILPTPEGNAAPTGPVLYHILDPNESNQMSCPPTTRTNKYAYRKRALELVTISRLFVQAQNQTFDSNDNLSLGG
jgi:hypothetical protein